MGDALDDELAQFEAELRAETGAPKPPVSGPRAPKVIAAAPMRSAPPAPSAPAASDSQAQHPTPHMPELGKQPGVVTYQPPPPAPPAQVPDQLSAQLHADAFMSSMAPPQPPAPTWPAAPSHGSSSGHAGQSSGGAGPSSGRAPPASSERPADQSFTKRYCAGVQWEDKTLLEWPEDDFRIFVGDLGQETNDDVLAHAFARYPSFQKAKVVRNKSSGKSMGYGFVSFKDPWDMTKALREMQGKYIGNRPVKVRKSEWKSRTLEASKGTGRDKAELEHSLAISVKSMSKGIGHGGVSKKNKYVKQKPKKGMPW